MLFVGSGDSYAAAVFAHELSDGAAEAWNPHELYLKPERARGRHVFLISSSGRTKANLQLARRLSRVAKRRIAFTAKPDSLLARVCDDTFLLRYRALGRLTSGTASFTASLLACAHLLGKLPRKIDPNDSMERAAKWANKVRAPLSGSFFFLGSGTCRALAEYGACKVHEVLGSKAFAQYPEQLGHAQLFSINPRQDVIVGIPQMAKDRAREVCQVLSQNGFRTSYISVPSRDPVSRSLEVSFHLQHLVLRVARKRGLKECAFLTNGRRLRLSSKLIY